MPTEQEQVDKLLRRYSPEQIARAYLKASRRARDAEDMSKMMGGINDALCGAVHGDDAASKAGLEEVRKVLRTRKQTAEGKA